MKLEIIDLHVDVDGKEIIKGVSLTFEQGKIHALIGPNGSGKTTLAQAVMGNPRYKITQGKIILDGENITDLSVDKKAQKGLFLSFQYPVEVPGVSISRFLREAINTRREKPYSVMEFRDLLHDMMKTLDMDPSFARRNLNEGFSGGEKKRAEILQLAILKPKFAILDETDSGLDVDALKIVTQSINKININKKIGIIAITHYNKFLSSLAPDKVNVMLDGKIVAQGDENLAKKIEVEGFKPYMNEKEDDN